MLLFVMACCLACGAFAGLGLQSLLDSAIGKKTSIYQDAVTAPPQNPSTDFTF